MTLHYDSRAVIRTVKACECVLFKCFILYFKVQCELFGLGLWSG